MSVKALAKGVTISPRKVGVVAALVRGRSVADALIILDNTPRRSAEVVKQVVKSAKANAENNHKLKPGTLMITEISVAHGPRMKRFKPAARGRALPFQMKTSHIRVIVDGEKRVPKSVKNSAKTEKTAKTAVKKETK